MKSAEEWVKKLPLSLSEQVRQRELIKQIQLDAMREGMRRAAEVCLPKDQRNYMLSESAAKQRILSAAEQLTEKDL